MKLRWDWYLFLFQPLFPHSNSDFLLHTEHTEKTSLTRKYTADQFIFAYDKTVLCVSTMQDRDNISPEKKHTIQFAFV